MWMCYRTFHSTADYTIFELFVVVIWPWPLSESESEPQKFPVALHPLDTAERCSRIIAKPPSDSAVKVWLYNLTNSLQQTMNDEGAFPTLFPRRILPLVSNCKNLRNASPSFSKYGCIHTVKSVLRLTKRPNNVAPRISAQEIHFSHAKRNRRTLVSNPKKLRRVSPYFQVWGNFAAALHRLHISGAKGNVWEWVGRVYGASPRT